MLHSSGHFIILHLSFYYLLTLFWQISEKWLWHFWNTFVKCDTFVTNLWKMVTLLWRICNLCNFIIFLLSFNYLVTLLWHICKNFGTSIEPEYRTFVSVHDRHTEYRLLCQTTIQANLALQPTWNNQRQGPFHLQLNCRTHREVFTVLRIVGLISLAMSA